MNTKIVTSSILALALVANISVFSGHALAISDYDATITGLKSSGLPPVLTVDKAYTFNVTISPKVTISADDFGFSFDRIDVSGGKILNDPDDDSIDLRFIADNRAAGRDEQHAYSPSGYQMSNASWSVYQCGLVHKNNLESGKSFTVSCTFTPHVTGFYQVDINTSRYYAVKEHACDTGHCGPITGNYFKVVSAPRPTPKPTCAPTPTPTPTPMPTPTSVPTPTPASAVIITNNNTNNNTNVNNNNVNVTVQTATQTATVQPAVVATTTLPKTGVPLEAYGLFSFLPLGWKLRKFAKLA